MADLTSQNELAVNGVQWGASLMAVGTVNINTQASCSLLETGHTQRRCCHRGQPNMKRL